ncbi:hypothetical protein G7B40_033305 [Aetokthonos hydrillicola Thurmond2011]|jgi:hypothetical protein|uniref:FtsH ternary system domain-containing protein n=1 Tax=Aetokthonos hydrillicola Thurmond2011 TaxID=2712845 RepID=A0AAP5MCN6_9CYAN|nr:hypothetical protein [Aetokthonos hydrillicola]MBO3459560.1 hypothetical protein [Aetokthonos hydrillicola CCALA 1050]MBW4590310.1 hypothetical protein [Aetokthonos hydrillicola CCALA 1050]MDR9899402.1 hypothetical protein [Aetokthonos hydrillicola Thurmond2011]
MSASETVLQVIEWAMMSHEARVAPPQGDLSAVEKLNCPSANLVQAIAQLTSVTAARLRWEMPPLGDNSPIGVSNFFMAAALGTANPQLARTLLKTIPPSSCSGDWVTRYGLLTPALPFLGEDIADDCRQLSPLTTVLHRPIRGQESVAVNLVLQLLQNSTTKLSLTLHLAQPTIDIQVRNWRTELLDRLRLTQQNFVLDVYEAAMIYHEQEVIHQVKTAYSVMSDRQAASDEERLRDALSIANWWKPLWTIERSDIDQLRARRYLGYAYREGIKLYKFSQKMLGLGVN